MREGPQVMCHAEQALAKEWQRKCWKVFRAADLLSQRRLHTCPLQWASWWGWSHKGTRCKATTVQDLADNTSIDIQNQSLLSMC